MKTQLTIKYKRPFFWRLLKLRFPEYDPEGTVAVSFAKFVYANQDFSDDYKVHENTHLDQQGHSYFGAVIWWIGYFLSKEFRFSQELEAFQNQYTFIMKTNPSARYRSLDHFAKQLSGELYGGVATYDEAVDEIKKKILR